MSKPIVHFYTYLHTRNDDQSVFYVGKGKGQRAHSTANRNSHWHRIVIKHGHTLMIAESFRDEQDAFAHERYLIASFRALGLQLCNMTDGGEGSSGCIRSEEYRAAQTNSWKNHDVRQKRINGIKKSLTGKNFSDERRYSLRNSFSDKTKPVLCIETGTCFTTTRRAADWLVSQGNLNAKRGSIIRSCANKRRSAYGYTWQYVQNSPQPQP